MSRWEEAEGVDFTVLPSEDEHGTAWIWLHCSVHGELSAGAAPRDLGWLSVLAQSHYERRHLP